MDVYYSYYLCISFCNWYCRLWFLQYTKEVILTYIIVSFLVIIAAISKAVMDTISFHYDTSVFKNSGTWFNPSLSWNNKYTWSKNKFIAWLLQNPLVLLTDAWHFFGFIQRVKR